MSAAPFDFGVWLEQLGRHRPGWSLSLDERLGGCAVAVGGVAAFLRYCEVRGVVAVSARLGELVAVDTGHAVSALLTLNLGACGAGPQFSLESATGEVLLHGVLRAAVADEATASGLERFLQATDAWAQALRQPFRPAQALPAIPLNAVWG